MTTRILVLDFELHRWMCSRSQTPASATRDTGLQNSRLAEINQYPALDWLLRMITNAILVISPTSCYNFRYEDAP
jgi:hypothetical protein